MTGLMREMPIHTMRSAMDVAIKRSSPCDTDLL
eukprot:CAMPEP_0171622886 /NCGR_PEP_ID=MMETSP0990-20121206/17558_1 /TAXON_ID=483369 /ORGANISM="non described non described, Strain CCMP2098" /LENGTH=32 /DNA_ID= /DNA_START= /DNA_END= /DNA_ORIENTATION=